MSVLPSLALKALQTTTVTTAAAAITTTTIIITTTTNMITTIIISTTHLRILYTSFSSAGWFCKFGRREDKRPVSVLMFKLKRRVTFQV